MFRFRHTENSNLPTNLLEWVMRMLHHIVMLHCCNAENSLLNVIGNEDITFHQDVLNQDVHETILFLIDLIICIYQIDKE